MKYRKIGVALVALLALVVLAGCGSGGKGQQAYSVEFGVQGADTLELNKDQPIPAFRKSEIRQELIDIETAEAEGVQSTSFFMPEGNSKTADPQGSCASIGAPVQATDQLTNPHQIIKDNKSPINNGGGNQVVDQEDPNGIYQGDTSGTWVMCINPSTGKTYAEYSEAPVRMVMAPAKWNYTTHEPELTGQPPSIFNDVKVGGGITK